MRIVTKVLLLITAGEAARIVSTNTAKKQRWGRSCPPGLESSNETCVWRHGLLHDPDAAHASTWVRGSDHPLVFEEWGGLDDPDGELLKEVQFIATHPDFINHICHHLNESHHAQIGKIVHRLEENSENLEAVEFLAHHVAEELVLEGLALGFEVLGEAAAHAGFGVAAAGLEGTLAGVEVVTTVLGSPIVIGLTALHSAYMLRKHYHHKDTRARQFSIALVSKSDCIINKAQRHGGETFDFIPDFNEVCGAGVAATLQETMLSTNRAFVGLFQEFKGVGKCLFPEGQRAWSKSNCANAIYEPLREHEGQSGILYTAISLAVAYGRETDQILAQPFYSQWSHKYLGMDLPASKTLANQLHALKDASVHVNDRASTCSMIVAVQHGFGRVFLRMRTALNVYMRSFAREELHFSTRTTQHPCRRVFHKIDAVVAPEDGVCQEGHTGDVQDTEWIAHRVDVLTGDLKSDASACFEDSHPEVDFTIFSTVDEE